jgi:hypothetical protein
MKGFLMPWPKPPKLLAAGMPCPKGHLLLEENIYITPNNGRIRCKTCIAITQKAYREAHKGELKTYYKKWDEDNKDKRIEISRKSTLKNQYGITPEEYDLMVIAQNNLCAICGREQAELRNKYVGSPTKRLDIDHDHITGEIRGLLCRKCNTGLGLFLEDPVVLAKAIEYLTTNRAILD